MRSGLIPKRIILLKYAQLLPIHRPIILAGSVISAFLIHAKGIPGSRTENFILGYIVHADRDSQYGAKGQNISADMSIADSAMICPPVVHNRIS